MPEFKINMNNDIKIYLSSRFVTEPLSDIKSNKFQLANIDGVPCAYCGQSMVSSDTLYYTFTKNRTANTLAIDRALNLKQFLKPFKRKVLETMDNIRKTYKLNNDSDIIEFCLKKAIIRMQQHLEENSERIADIIEDSDNEFLKKKFNKTKSYLARAVKEKNPSKLLYYVRNRHFLGISGRDDISPIGIKMNELMKDIFSKDNWLPEEYMNRHLLIEYPEYSYKILFRASMATIEHIRPVFVGGKDRLSNYLAVCKECNYKRGHIHLTKFLRENPEIDKNLKNYFLTMDKSIFSYVYERRLPDLYLQYPNMAKKTIYYLTGRNYGVKY